MPSIYLTQTLASWHSPRRESVLQRELEQLDPGLLPLREAMARGNQIAAEPVRVLVLSTADEADAYRARVGLLFASLIGGCQCADDPSPLEALPEYAELEIRIDRRSGVVQWQLRD